MSMQLQSYNYKHQTQFNFNLKLIIASISLWLCASERLGHDGYPDRWNEMMNVEDSVFQTTGFREWLIWLRKERFNPHPHTPNDTWWNIPSLMYLDNTLPPPKHCPVFQSNQQIPIDTQARGGVATMKAWSLCSHKSSLSKSPVLTQHFNRPKSRTVTWTESFMALRCPSPNRQRWTATTAESFMALRFQSLTDKGELWRISTASCRISL